MFAPFDETVIRSEIQFALELARIVATIAVPLKDGGDLPAEADGTRLCTRSIGAQKPGNRENTAREEPDRARAGNVKSIQAAVSRVTGISQVTTVPSALPAPT